MKSKLSLFTLIVFSILMITSCTKLEKVLAKKDGKWNVTRTLTRSTVGGIPVYDSTSTNPNMSYTFNDDGTGLISSGISSSTSFTWTSDNKAETITIVISGITTIWQVTDESRKELKANSTLSLTLGGVVSVLYNEIDMTRAE